MGGPLRSTLWAMRLWLLGAALVCGACSLAYPLDFTGGGVDAGGDGGDAGGADAGLRDAGGADAGGADSGGADAGNADAGSADAGGPFRCPSPLGVLLACLDFEAGTLPMPMVQTQPGTPPSSLATGAVVPDGGPSGGALRLVLPAAPSASGAHGLAFAFDFGAARRFQVDFDFRPVRHRAGDQLHFALFAFVGAAPTSLAGDPGDFLVYSNSTSVTAGTGTLPRWQHLQWQLDLPQGTTRLLRDGALLVDRRVDAGFSAAPAQFRFGIAQLFRFDVETEILLDNLVVSPLP